MRQRGWEDLGVVLARQEMGWKGPSWAVCRSVAGLWESLGRKRGLSERVRVVRFRYFMGCRPEWGGRTRDSETWVDVSPFCGDGELRNWVVSGRR